MKEILLGESKSKRNVNEDNFTNVELFSTERVMPIDSITQTLDSYKEYLSEKDSSEKYRLIFTINPVCTNVLFNSGTEIVYKEGSDGCECVTNEGLTIDEISNYQNYKWGDSSKTLTRLDAIRDTAYSHPDIGGLVYHCGVDIFNNHMLRKRTFKVVNKITSTRPADGVFNTIRDFMRDSDGNSVKEHIFRSAAQIGNVNPTPLHLYQLDETRTYHESVYDGLVESDGWLGFLNPVTMDIPNFGDISINKCMNNNKANEFIDMYPDRSLYSFIPKYNKYRHRFEYNWDYVITYPFENDYDNDLVRDGIRCEFYDLNELEGSYFDKEDGKTNLLIHFRTQIKNSFYRGSFVRLNFGGYTTENPVKVESIGINGEDTQHVFGVNLESLIGCLINICDEGDASWRRKLSMLNIWAKKNIRGADCEYYLRKFKAIKGLNSSLNPLAFAENIYSDKIAQIVFNDDINTEDLKDNLGRNISEVYLTIVKRNKGNKEWYENNNYGAETVEFSHCFGEVSSGFDLSPEDEKYNIHKLTAANREQNSLENDITEERDWFYGDIVEFSPYTVEEIVLEDVYHRFNTMQRETELSDYGRIYYDRFNSDDYDLVENGNQVFNISLESFYSNSNKANICNEGYYYKPHYRVKLKAFDENVKQGNHIKMSFNDDITSVSENVYSGTTKVPYGLQYRMTISGETYHGSTLYLINRKTGEQVNAEVTKVSGIIGTEIEFEVENAITIENYDIYKPNPSKPAYAYELNDGTARYFWREILPENKILYGDELYNSMFTNGAHYFHTGINFYLKRQDPSGKYGLNLRNSGDATNIDVFTGVSEGQFKEISMAEYVSEGENDIC